MKIEWLVADVTIVGALDRTEHAILEVILAKQFIGQFSPSLWSGSNVVMWEPLLEP